MTMQYDLAVIGSGPGGYVAAAYAAGQGLKTAIIEKDKSLGGTCLHRGCIPTKALLHAADVYSEISHADKIGIKVSGAKIDWPQIQKYKDSVVNGNALGVAHLIKSKKVDHLSGFGSLINNHTISVKNGGEEKNITAKNIIVAVGSKPKTLPTADNDSPYVLTSDTILSLKEIPSSLTIVGGGVIGIEFASVFIRLGCKVTVIEYMPNILSMADEECSKEMKYQLEKQGVVFHTNAKVKKISNKKNEAHTIFADEKNNTIQIDSNYVLVSIGREALTKGIGLENTTIKLDEKSFIKTDEYLRTDEKNIYAIGDCINTPWLAHVASKEAMLAVDHILQRHVVPLNYVHTPSCVYSDPPLAFAGITEEEAKKQNISYKVSKFDFLRNGKSAILQNKRGFVKFISDTKYGEILGVHIIGPQATELLAEPSFAMQMEATIDDIAHTVHAHPTLYESIYEAALTAVNKNVHG